MEKKDNNKKEPEKKSFEDLSEEEIKELNEQLKKIVQQDKELQKRRTQALFFHYAIHPKFGIHVIIQWLINIFVLSAAIGLTQAGYVSNLYLYLLGVTLFTFVEMFIKILFFKYLQKIVIASFNSIHLVYILPILYVSIELVGKVTFAFVYQRFIVALIFILLRAVASYYIKLIVFSRRKK